MGLIKAENSPPSVAPFSMKDIENHARGILLRARKQAEQLLAAAQVEAEIHKKQAHVEGLAEGRAEGHRKGHEDGRKSGHDAALNEHRANLSNLVKSLQSAMAQLESSRQQMESSALREVIELAAAISRRVTKRQGMLDPQVLIANLADAMRLVVHATDVRIAVHPSQKKTLVDELPKLQMAWPQLKHVELIEDATLSPGGCRVFTTHGKVDGDLDVQLDRVIAELLPDVVPP